MRRAERLLQAAMPLALDMNAHLTALAVLPPFIIVPAADGMGTTVSIDSHRVAYRAEIDRLKRLFTAASTGRPVPSEWREADAGFGTTAAAIIEHGRCADLIIAAQKDESWVSTALLEDPVRLAMESGRPVLLIPNAGRMALPAKRVTVAWNGRREAARAVFDAVPLLASAEDVNIVSVNPDKEMRAEDLPAAGICAALARHGVKPQAVQATAIGADVGPELLRQAAAFGSDLLVMGCYGHSRLREFILGGASRHVLGQMNLPVLLSH